MKLQPTIPNMVCLFVGNPADLVGTGWQIISSERVGREATTNLKEITGRNLYLSNNGNSYSNGNTSLSNYYLNTRTHRHKKASSTYQYNADPVVTGGEHYHSNNVSGQTGRSTATMYFNQTVVGYSGAANNFDHNMRDFNLNTSANNVDVANTGNNITATSVNTGANIQKHSHSTNNPIVVTPTNFNSNQEYALRFNSNTDTAGLHQHDLKDLPWDDYTSLGGHYVYLIQWVGI